MHNLLKPLGKIFQGAFYISSSYVFFIEKSKIILSSRHRIVLYVIKHAVANFTPFLAPILLMLTILDFQDTKIC